MALSAFWFLLVPSCLEFLLAVMLGNEWLFWILILEEAMS